MLSFNVIVDILDDGLLKLSCIGCLHGSILVEVFRVVSCGKIWDSAFIFATSGHLHAWLHSSFHTLFYCCVDV